MAYLAVLGGVRLRLPYLYGCDVWDGEVVRESHTIEGIEEKFAEINIKLYIHILMLCQYFHYMQLSVQVFQLE